MLRSALVFLLLAPLCAQETHKIANVPRFNGKAFIPEVSLLAASETADAITTRRLLDRSGWETNPAFGRHPSPAKQAGINLGFFAAQSTAFYFTQHSRHKWISWTGRAFLANAIEQHSRLAACNPGIDPRSPAIRHCNSFVRF